MNLYLCKIVSGDEFFVVAQHPTEAQEVLETALDEAGYSHSLDRGVKEICVLAKEIDCNKTKRVTMNMNTRLLIAERYRQHKENREKE